MPHHDDRELAQLHHTLVVLLAGGKGSRLEPLTRDRAKPAVPFGGSYRIIDFSLSNCINSGLRKIMLLTQYKVSSLDRHINLGWKQLLSRELGEFIDVVPPQQRIDEHWYQGTADAVYQNIYTLEKERSQYVLILAGDHIYKMNYRPLIEFHQQKEADLTISALRVRAEEARHFGVMQIDADGRVVGFEEKVPGANTIPGDPRHCLASMGIYVFNCPVSLRAVVPRCHPAGQRRTISATTSSPPRSTPIASSLIPSATKTASKTPIGATWARWTPIMKPTWTWSPSIRN